MRQLSFLLLLATAAAPALAAPGDEGDPGGRRHRGEAAEQPEGRPQRVRSEPSPQSGERQFGTQRSDRSQPAPQGTTESERVQQHRLEKQPQSASTQSGSNDSAATPRRRARDDASETQSSLRPRERRILTIPDTQPSATATQSSSEVVRTFEGRSRRDYRDGNYRHWSTNHWRNDHRYDWRRWRDRHRSLFRLGFYYDPFGWSYRRWALGSFLYPSYYGSRYWLNDPWDYRLPPAYGPYRWVRYWDDAFLVNIYTAQVVDVIYNFFW